MLFQTTSAHEELRAKIRSFAEEEIKPLAFLMDQNNEFPEEAVKKLGKLGWMGIPDPKEYGGAGLDALSYADVYKRQLEYTCKYQIISLYGMKLLWQDPREARIRPVL